ncbi:glycosyltransferase family 2 protein [Marivirga sp. S37H4]|uniref:Glycosyltransferase family 2 protein n=1 Tax=Marivirga aurantiaca TaxID=2802615 RepID=A0A934X1B7_9BACT|nr:glycosyltransferase family 2 protein [Marivirga aurantiaca]MBK6266506.1 glycosyltransferase family 2 protein [Marivirga aurantiaca]
MSILLICLEVIIAIYFVYVALYTFVFGFAGNFYRIPTHTLSERESKFVVLIPAYKEDNVIIDVAELAIAQNYPSDKFEVVIIADSFQAKTIEKLKKLPVTTIEVVFEKSTKVKALNKVLGSFPDEHTYDYAVILDADNVMEPGFLRTMNSLHQQGYKAIQGQRAAKNENTTLSFLDGLSENINNNIYGKGSVVLGCSASLKGSGMSFDFNLLKNHLAKMDSIGGFDRELELRLVKSGIKVHYAENAIVKDEKVEKSEVFENQRKRWISSQYHYLKAYFGEGVRALFQGNFALFNSVILRNIQLPRLLNIGLVNVFFLVAAILHFYYPILYLDIWVWLSLALLLDLGVAFSISREYFSFKLVKSIILLPGIFLKMMLLMFKLKGANKKFIHTPHGSTSGNKA